MKRTIITIATIFFMIIGLTIASAENQMSYDKDRNQFSGGFSPSNAPYGGFGGPAGVSVDHELISPNYPNDYPSNTNQTWTIQGPADADTMNVHFSDFNTESGYDKVFIMDANDTVIATYSGNKGAFTSAAVEGNVIKIRLISDYSVNRDGFKIDNYSYGALCTATHIPVIFIHGNGDEAKNWDYPSANQSVYDYFRAKGYQDCELFGVNYSSESENKSPQNLYHNEKRANIIADFINDVLQYTGKDKVKIISHSLGVTMALHALDVGNVWDKVDTFVGICGGIRGLQSCLWMGAANPLAPTCGSENYYNNNVFGFYPDVSFSFPNSRLGSGSDGFRNRPLQHPNVKFYSIGAGLYDQILCNAATQYFGGCENSWKFVDAPNVIAQLNVGHGTPADQMDYDFEDWSPYNMNGGDAGGAGHFVAKVSTSHVQYNIIENGCNGSDCCSDYNSPCQNEATPVSQDTTDGWTAVSYELKSPNYPSNYDNSYDNTWTINAANDVTRIRVKFSSFNTEEDYDNVYIYDGSDIEYEVLTGDMNTPFYTAEIPGNVVKIRLISDQSVNRKGFAIDAYEVLK